MGDLDDLNSLAADLHRSVANVGARGALVVRKSAHDIEATAKAFAPVDTGFLRSSIGADFTGDGRSGVMEAVIGPTAEYGAHVEYGTARQAPQAYMGPALDRHAPDFERALLAVADDL
jgi:HK97 gp10 family phage protein